MIKLETDQNIENLAETQYDNPILVQWKNRKLLLREVWDDQAEFLGRNSKGNPAMYYLKLDMYKIESHKLIFPDPSYEYEKGDEFDQELKKQGI